MSAFQQLWCNMNTGKTHLIKLDSDVKVRNDGSSNTYFTPNLSGFYGSKIRYKFGVTQPSVLPELPSYLRAKNSETVNTPRGKKDHSRREILSMENSPRSKNSSPVTIKSKLKHITNNNAYLDCEQSPNLGDHKKSNISMFVTYDSKIHSRKVSQKGVMQKST